MSNPGNITTAPVLWLQADAGVTSSGGLVSAWADQSAGLNHATASGTSRPSLIAAALNGLPVIRFAGSPQVLTLTAAFYPGVNWTVCFVSRKTASGNVLVTLANTNNDPVAALFFSDNVLYAENQVGYSYCSDAGTTPNYWSIRNAANVLSTYRGGALQTSGFTGNPSANLWNMLGACPAGGRWSNGDIAELIVFPAALTDADRGAVESYLHAKWFVAPVQAGWLVALLGA